MKPIIILVEPQLGENIGAVARAMLNCGLNNLRVVNPRDGWPNEKALAASAGADSVIHEAQLFDSVDAAIADLTLVYAASARSFNLNKPIDTLEQAAERMVQHQAQAGRVGVMFGRERTGLESEDVARASRLLTIPLNPDFMSLNIAQAVLLVAYGWYREQGLRPLSQDHRYQKTQAATQEQLDGLVQHFSDALDNANFFTSANKRPSMLRNLRAAFARMEPTEQDVQTFRGIVKALVLGRRNP